MVRREKNSWKIFFGTKVPFFLRSSQWFYVINQCRTNGVTAKKTVQKLLSSKTFNFPKAFARFLWVKLSNFFCFFFFILYFFYLSHFFSCFSCYFFLLFFPLFFLYFNSKTISWFLFSHNNKNVPESLRNIFLTLLLFKNFFVFLLLLLNTLQSFWQSFFCVDVRHFCFFLRLRLRMLNLQEHFCDF